MLKDCLVIVKFFANTNAENSSKLISRTLGKVAFISRTYKGPLPKDEEFYKCKIIEEVNPGERRGCFLLEPVEKVLESSIERLLQGFYDEKLQNGILFIKPHQKGNYILPLTHKKSINDVYSIIVDLKDFEGK